MVNEIAREAIYTIISKIDIAFVVLIYSIWWNHIKLTKPDVSTDSFCIAMAIFWVAFLLR